MPGFLLIDKTDGLTSHDVVARVRRATGKKRVGHAGTLDPFATGLLLVGVEREATREFQKFVGLEKTYEAVFVLGVGSDTDDRTGTLTEGTVVHVTEQEVDKALTTFIGEIDQIPPAYAAIKIDGKKMYEAAREGKPLDAPARHVRIDTFERLSPVTPTIPCPSAKATGAPAEASREGWPSYPPTALQFTVRIHCSSGTYIRSLARDLGKSLGTLGLVAELRRTAIGPFSVSEALPLKNLSPETVQNALISVEPMLSRLR